MRRKDREITDFKQIMQIISECDCFRIGLTDDDGLPYIVPLNFGFEVNDGNPVLYFHGSKAGKKAELLKQQPILSFEMDCSHELKEAGENAGAYSYYYGCVMGKGTVVALETPEDKIKAFKAIMRKYTKRDDFEFPKRALDAVAVYKIEVKSLTCKAHVKV